MKKIISILISVMCIFCFAACKDDSGIDNPSATPPEFKDDIAVNLSNEKDERYLDRVVVSATFAVDKNVPNSNGALKINNLFGNGMILQRNTVNCLFGVTSSQYIAVEIKDALYYGSITDGVWKVYLPLFEADNNALDITIYTESEKLKLTDVYFGDIFICAGQSNMDTVLGQYPDHADDVKNASDDKLRLFNVPKVLDPDTVNSPIEIYSGACNWTKTTPQTVAGFSAVGYLFGKQLREELKIPIGLFGTAIGGSAISYWLPQDAYDTLITDGKALYCYNSTKYPSTGYDGMINPLNVLNIKGVVWYQGESDATNTTQNSYEAGMQTLISSWRDEFDNPKMLWQIIELPRYQNTVSGYGEVRTVQQNVAADMDRVYMSVSIDLGDWQDIHPGNKTEIAHRAANEILFQYYGVTKSRYPKIVKTIKLADNKFQFDCVNVGDGLNLINKNVGFEIYTNRGTIKKGYTVNLTDNKNGFIVEYELQNNVFEKICYGINPLVDTIPQMTDVSKQLCLYNSYGLPLDQFIYTERN